MHAILTRKALAIIGSVVLGTGLLGGVAWAAVPAAGDQLAASVPSVGTTASDKDGHGAERIKKALDALVDKGVISREQAEAVLKALTAEAKHGGKGGHVFGRAFMADMMRTSAEYLGLTGDQLKDALAGGHSLSEIAAKTAGKSRDGLIKRLDDEANAFITKAVADGKLTSEQAEQARTHADQAIVKLVDHERKAHDKHDKKPKPKAAPAAL